MADTKSVVVLVQGSFESSESPETLERSFSRGSPSDFQEVEDVRGAKHWVKLAHVVEIREPGD